MPEQEFVKSLFDTGLIERDEFVQSHVRSFYRLLRSRRNFAWVGVFKTEDIFERHWKRVYVLDNEIGPQQELSKDDSAELGRVFIDALDKLTLVMRPTFYLDFYYCHLGDNSGPEILVDRIKNFKSDDFGEIELLWQDDLTLLSGKE